MALNQTQVSQLYVALFGRASEGEGNTFWQAEADQATAANAMLATSAASTYFGTSLNSNQAFVEHIYLNTLGKTLAQDPDGIAFWVKALTDGNSRGFVVAELIKSATDAATAGTAQDQFLNRVEVSNYMATTVQTAPADYATSTAFKSAAKPTGALDVTSVAATVTTAKAAVDTIKPQSFTLTTGNDTFTGGAGDDTFTASLLTLGDGDVLNGGAGTDTLNAEINANVGLTAAYTNIEKMNLTAFGAKSVDMKVMTGVTEVNSVNSTGAITLNNALATTKTFGFAGSSTNSIIANHAAGALAGTADIATINLNTAKAVAIDLDAGFESATVNVTGTSDIDTFTIPGVTTVTVAGSGNVDFANTTLDGIATLSAATYTGAMTTGTASAVTGFVNADILGNALVGTTALLGSGNDNIGFTDAITVAGKSNTIKLGAGNDKLLLTTSTVGATYVFGEAGDDSIRSGAIDDSDLIDGGAGTDTLTLTANTTGTGAVLRGIENLTIENTATAVVLNSDDSATVVSYKVDNSAASITGLSAGSTVTVSDDLNATAGVVALTVGYKAVEAAATIAVSSTKADGAVTINNVTAATLNYAKAASSVTAGITTDVTTALTINATKSVTTGAIASSNKLKSLTIVGQDAVATGAVSSTALETVSATAVKAITVGAMGEAGKLTSVSVSSSTDDASITSIGAANKNNTTAAMSVTLAGAKAATLGTVGDATGAGKLGDISATATNGLLTAGAITGTDAGTITLTSTAGAIDGTAAQVTVADATGVTVNMNAKTFITDDGLTGGGAITVQNTGGNITAALSGAAAAKVNYTAVTKGIVSLAATNTGGLTSTITNVGTAGAGETSTITLGNAASTKTNAITIVGTVDTVNVTGGTGTDTVILGAGAMKGGTISLAGGTDTVDFTLQDGIKTAANGVVINLSSSTVTFSDTGTTSVAAGKALEYDSASASAKVVSGGYSFTLSDIEAVVGTNTNDYIVANAAGTTITGGVGTDTIIVGAGVDNVSVNKTAVAGSVSDYDLITGFSAGGGAGNDNIIALDSSFAFANGTTDGTVVLATHATTLDGAHTANNNFTVATIGANIATHTLATFLAGTSTIAQLEAAAGTAMGAATDANFANTDKFLVAIDDGTHTGIFYVESAASADAIADSELSLVAILSGVADATTLVAGDFLFA